MQEHTFDGTLTRAVVIDVCAPCQAFWFDGRESLLLSPGATLTLFRIIGEHAARPLLREADVAKCRAATDDYGRRRTCRVSRGAR